MKDKEFFPNGQKEHLTYYKGLFTYAVTAGVLIFLTSVGILSKLLFWTPSVFMSTMLMFVLVIFYSKKSLKRTEFVSREKDAIDVIRKKLLESKNALAPFGADKDLVFATNNFLEKHSSQDLSETLTAEYFRNIGERIKSVISKTGGVARVELVNTDDLKFCFVAGMERNIKPMVNAGTKLMLAGFFGTIAGIILIAIDLKFFGSSEETRIGASELAGGLGVAGITTMLGLAGRYILGSLYEQMEDIRDRTLSEITRITCVYGLDLLVFEETQENKGASDE